MALSPKLILAATKRSVRSSAAAYLLPRCYLYQKNYDGKMTMAQYLFLDFLMRSFHCLQFFCEAVLISATAATTVGLVFGIYPVAQDRYSELLKRRIRLEV